MLLPENGRFMNTSIWSITRVDEMLSIGTIPVDAAPGSSLIGTL